MEFKQRERQEKMREIFSRDFVEELVDLEEANNRQGETKESRVINQDQRDYQQTIINKPRDHPLDKCHSLSLLRRCAWTLSQDTALKVTHWKRGLTPTPIN